MSTCLFAAFLAHQGLNSQSISMYLSALQHLQVSADLQPSPRAEWPRFTVAVCAERHCQKSTRCKSSPSSNYPPSPNHAGTPGCRPSCSHECFRVPANLGHLLFGGQGSLQSRLPLPGLQSVWGFAGPKPTHLEMGWTSSWGRQVLHSVQSVRCFTTWPLVPVAMARC